MAVPLHVEDRPVRRVPGPKTWIPENTFASRLVRIRRALRLQLIEISELYDIKMTTYASWERGAMPHDMTAAIDKIVEATAVDGDWLRFGDEPEGQDWKVQREAESCPFRLIVGTRPTVEQLRFDNRVATVTALSDVVVDLTGGGRRPT